MSKYFKDIFKKYFLFGLLISLPFYITIKFLTYIISYFDNVLEIQNGRFLYLIPKAFHPNEILGFNIPGLGLLVSLAFITMVGVVGRNYFGHKLLGWFDQLVNHIPFARTIYKVVKETLNTFANNQGRDAFSSVVLVEYPRPGMYSLAFVTNQSPSQAREACNQDLINLFIPTTPNPTSGFLIMVPKSQTKKLDMSIEHAFKLIVSGGMIQTNNDPST